MIVIFVDRLTKPPIDLPKHTAYLLPPISYTSKYWYQFLFVYETGENKPLCLFSSPTLCVFPNNIVAK
jgi:hypothetical protein